MRFSTLRLPALLVALAAIGTSSGSRADDTSVHGRVMGQTIEGDHLGPVAGATVEFRSAGGAIAGSTVADDAGYYRIEGLAPSQYVYRIAAAGFREENAHRGLEVSAVGAHVLDFVLTQGEDKPQEEPADRPEGALVVRTWKEHDGKKTPVAGADVTLRSTDGGQLLHRASGAQGRNRLIVPIGTWRVSASVPGGASTVYPQPVEVDADGRRQIDLTIQVPPAPKRAPLPPPPPNDGRKACFYGDVAEARRIVFVVDKSNSMQVEKFDEAAKELSHSLNYLTAEQQFYVIFFSDGMHPMFEPDAPADLVAATAEQRGRVERFGAELPFRLGTNARPAVERALALKPDVIYLLGDGAFTDDTGRYLLELRDNPIPICTVAFKSKERGATIMKQIAERHHGRFMYVP